MNIEEAKRILGLTSSLTPEDVRQAFRKMAMRYHPDQYKTFSQQAWATHRFIKIKEAYDFLKSATSFDYESTEQYAKDFEGQETFHEYSEPEDQTLFSRLLDKLPGGDTSIRFILDILMLPLVIGFALYAFIVFFLQQIFPFFGLTPSPDSQSKHERFLFLAISSFAAFTYLPILYWIAFTSGQTSYTTTFRIVFAIASSAIVILFIVSEWISFFLSGIWRRSIQTDLEKYLPTKI